MHVRSIEWERGDFATQSRWHQNVCIDVVTPVNPKAVAGRARKAEAAERKAEEAAAAAEAEEDRKWQQGARGKTAADSRNEKAAEKARKKAELDRLKQEDEANTPGKASSGKGGGKSGGGGKGVNRDALDDIDMQIAALNATNLDDALEAMELVNAKSDKASRGAAAGNIERHPERRFKAAFEAYKERELPKLREERPGLRLQQYNEAMYKSFQKSSENPFNQLHVSYDATKEEKLAILKAKREATALRLGTK